MSALWFIFGTSFQNEELGSSDKENVDDDEMEDDAGDDSRQSELSDEEHHEVFGGFTVGNRHGYGIFSQVYAMHYKLKVLCHIKMTCFRDASFRIMSLCHKFTLTLLHKEK